MQKARKREATQQRRRGKSRKGRVGIARGSNIRPPGPSFSRIACMSEARLRSMPHKEIYRRLDAIPAKESLFADAISVSSTGKHTMYALMG